MRRQSEPRKTEPRKTEPRRLQSGHRRQASARKSALSRSRLGLARTSEPRRSQSGHHRHDSARKRSLTFAPRFGISVRAAKGRGREERASRWRTHGSDVSCTPCPMKYSGSSVRSKLRLPVSSLPITSRTVRRVRSTCTRETPRADHASTRSLPSAFL